MSSQINDCSHIWVNCNVIANKYSEWMVQANTLVVFSKIE